ncbi:UDP-glycosyltransferase 91D1-like [Brachypodium distachyon]|uniref:UDP-glycosyltransferase 91D1-like n=1 Tax=Brachypodium distachyon TaxID=15368 RepID=UPI00052FEAD7|nr:UDP-glycosyltransferase 91D1-like [Brachypodium distachyon]|eukprot:XP_010238933.1 UDP-glycosyltransferase 91D1-like [Brachypodium distachyon]
MASFLTHCGWNSTIEGLMFGRPLIMLPITDGGDQGPNARLMEGKKVLEFWKVGVRVVRDGDDGLFHRKGVAAAIQAVAVEEEGKRVFAANAKRMQEIVEDRECHERYIDRFVRRRQ